MALNLSDLMKKAKAKGIGQDISATSPSQLTRPWQEESVLFSSSRAKEESLGDPENIQRTTREQYSDSDSISLNSKYPRNIEITNRRTTREQQKEIVLPKNSVKSTDVIQGTSREQHDSQNVGIAHVEQEYNQRTAQRTTREQLETSKETSEEQQGNKRESNQSTSRVHKDNNPEIKQENVLENMSKADIIFILNSLIGLQKKLFDYLLEICLSNDEVTTGTVVTRVVANDINCSYDSVKVSLKRLIKKGLIKRLKGKGCRGGYIHLEIPKTIKLIAMESKKSHRQKIIYTQGNNRESKPENNQDNIATYSSSNNKKTTTNELSEEWHFDISPYNQFGFGITQLKQLIALGTISASEVEESLIEFNYDFENKTLPYIKTNKINFLMGLLRSGNSYVSENYRSEQEKVVKLMAERAAQKGKAQIEEKFMAWEYQLTNTEREEIVKKMPNHLIVLYNTNGANQREVKQWLMEYYMQKCSTYNIG